MVERFGESAVGTVVAACPAASPALAKPVHWVELVLVGEDGSPIPGEEYRLVLPNGDVARGFLDAAGKARVENIADAGSCQVSFPGLDKDAWA